MLNSFLENGNYGSDLFEENNYDNEIYLLNDVTINRKIRQRKRFHCFCLFIFSIIILSILFLQIICFLYINSIVSQIENLEINKLNITQTFDYIDKTETIIDYLCKNYVRC